MKRLLLLLGFSGIFLPVVGADHREDDHRRDEPRVILYEHADFRGASLVVYPGETIGNFSGQTYANGVGLNDSVSSLRVEGGAEVFVYANAHFRGAVLRLTENVRDLSGRLLADNPRENWNDRISSLRVEGPRRRSDGEGGRGALREGDCEIVIKRAYQDLLGRGPDENTLRSYRGRMIDQGWTEVMVRDHIRHGEEFRHEGVDHVIRRAYLDVLGREVDPNGLNHYRREMLDRNWTEGDVCEDLRRSEEFRKKSGRH